MIIHKTEIAYSQLVPVLYLVIVTSNDSCNQTTAVLIKETETWHQHNLAISDKVAKSYLLVPGISTFSLNENMLI